MHTTAAEYFGKYGIPENDERAARQLMLTGQSKDPAHRAEGLEKTWRDFGRTYSTTVPRGLIEEKWLAALGRVGGDLAYVWLQAHPEFAAAEKRVNELHGYEQIQSETQPQPAQQEAPQPDRLPNGASVSRRTDFLPQQQPAAPTGGVGAYQGMDDNTLAAHLDQNPEDSEALAEALRRRGQQQ
jgi:hypothetical protein